MKRTFPRFVIFLVGFTQIAAPGCGSEGSSAGGDAAADAVADDGSTVEDQDHDGFPAAEDCDDQDPGIYPGVSRDCSSLCDTGLETCLADASWSPCTAAPDSECACSFPGETRVVPCGNCGTGSQTCGPDLIWEPVTTCIGEGECAVGEVEEGPCQLCGTGTRICDNTCTWTPWEGCFGVCQPGEVETTSAGCAEAYEYRQSTCNAQCDWEDTIPCTPDCHLPARTGTTDFSDDVCIPGGPFLMGNPPGTGDPDTQPQHTVNLSPYFIDVFPVTVARYRTCVQTGVCPLPVSGSHYSLPGTDDWPIEAVSYDAALAFCAWDGGRTLPTEAQWEKSARGPAPSTVRYPWGDTAPTCAESNAAGCNGPGYSYTPVDAHPLGASYYGAREMGGNGVEWCLDWWAFDYYSNSPSFDPPGPAQPSLPDMRSVRDAIGANSTESAVTYRGLRDFDDGFAGFRCARRGY